MNILILIVHHLFLYCCALFVSIYSLEIGERSSFGLFSCVFLFVCFFLSPIGKDRLTLAQTSYHISISFESLISKTMISCFYFHCISINLIV